MIRRLGLIGLVALAFACGALGYALKRSHDENLCWRELVRDGSVPPEGDCRRL